MADLADIEQAIVNLVTTVIYPAGTTQASIIGSQCRIYRGWPVAANLNSDLSAGVINVTVSPDEEPGRTTTRYFPRPQIISYTPGTTIIAQSNTLTVGGTPTTGDLAGALINGAPYIYPIQANDTIGLVASGLAGTMIGSLSVTVTGSTLTINQPARIIARVVSRAASAIESRRQEKCIRVIFWCPDPTSRDTLAIATDQQMAQTTFLSIADGTSARIIYRNTRVYDQAQNASLFRRDLIYLTEYATISTQNLPSMLFGDVMIAGNAYYG
jgi:hypothetical protein